MHEEEKIQIKALQCSSIQNLSKTTIIVELESLCKTVELFVINTTLPHFSVRQTSDVFSIYSSERSLLLSSHLLGRL